EELEKLVEPGITLEELDQAAKRETEKRGATCAFKDLYGFPKHICISVNDQVVHAIPGKRKLLDGDLVKLDHGAVVRGWYGDSARTVPVGKVSAEAHKLLEVTRESLEAGIRATVAGNQSSDLAAAVAAVVALLAAAAAAGHAYVLPWAVLFELPVPGERACAISSLRYGPPDGKWERGTQQDKPASCEFRQFVLPGRLLPSWAEPVELDEVRVTYTVQGSE